MEGGEPVEVLIRRNPLVHRWVIVAGSRELQTPWVDSADAVSVITWIKTGANGCVLVRVEC
jgi:hypothetical protein